MRVGESPIRVDGEDKVTGRTRFAADLSVQGLWHAAVARSLEPCGRISRLDLPPALEIAPAVIVTADHIPGDNVIAVIEPDMPCLARDRVSYLGEPVALVAAPSARQAREIAARIRVHVDPEPAVWGIEALAIRVLASDPSLTLFSDIRIEDGDVEAALAGSDLTIEGTYMTGLQEHVYIEPQTMIAFVDGNGIRILGSMQCPYYVRPAVARVMALPEERVIVQQAPTGGAFGGKEDYPSTMACHAALLARACGHPVRLVLDRTEDMAFTTKRHASWTRLTTGCTRHGRLEAIDGLLVLDAGAYVTLSPVVLSRALLHACGPYMCPNVSFRAVAVRSNMPPSGAFRGFGAPQSQFAIESQMDEIAHRLCLSPAIVRSTNLLATGDRMATGQVMGESVGARACLESVLLRSGYHEMRTVTGSSPVRTGIGLACCMHGAGFTGNGERRLGSRARLKLTPDGVVDVLVSTTEMGQGLLTTFTQIVCSTLLVPPTLVRFELPDTSLVPDSGPTVASRSTMIVGRLVERASRDLEASLLARIGGQRDKEHVLLPSGQRLTWVEASRRVAPLEAEVQHQVPNDQKWDETSYRGTAYPVYSWGAAVAKVTVDMDTFVVTPDRLWLAYEVGKAVNPLAARGQLEGGSLQALGWALSENITVSDGRYAQDRLQTYIVPTCADAPPMDLEIIEMPWSQGPSGAKGLGELPMNAVAPALRNAVRHAMGLSPTSIPLTPESLMALVERAR